MQRPRQRLAFSLFAIIGAFALASCEPDASPRAKDTAKGLGDFYKKYTIRGGWGVFGIEAKGHDVVIPINVPQRQAEDLMKMAEPDRKTFIARNTCPPSREEVWSMLDEDGDIIIQARENGNMFAEVPCRSNK